jgi:hypothetical protein
MAGSRPDLLQTPAELRREAERLLDVAIQSEAPAVRKRLLVSSYELLQRAELVSERANGSGLEPPDYGD